MTLEKNIFVADIQDNQEVKDLFLVKTARLSETRAGKPFITLELMDRSGEVLGRVWDNAERLAPVCPAGAVVMVSGRAQLYKGALQLSVTGVESVTVAGADWGLFLPATSGDIEAMEAELIALIKKIEDKNIRSLLQAIVKDQDLWTAFRTAPAAKTMHHAYIGGLLEHTLGLCRLAGAVCALYPTLNHSLLLAGAILHDLGKIREFSFDTPPFDYSEQGRLLGHMTIALEIIQQKMSGLRDFPERMATMIKHLVISHHGSHEFGSPTLPMIREAFVLNFLDDLDAKMNYLDRLSRQAPTGEYQFTEYQRNLERFLFVTGHPAQVENRTEAEPEQAGNQGGRQPSLWG